MTIFCYQNQICLQMGLYYIERFIDEMSVKNKINKTLWLKYQWWLYSSQHTCTVSNDHYVSLDVMNIKKIISHKNVNMVIRGAAKTWYSPVENKYPRQSGSYSNNWKIPYAFKLLK